MEINLKKIFEFQFKYMFWENMYVITDGYWSQYYYKTIYNEQKIAEILKIPVTTIEDMLQEYEIIYTPITHGSRSRLQFENYQFGFKHMDDADKFIEWLNYALLAKKLI
jgi:hypothetical protein